MPIEVIVPSFLAGTAVSWVPRDPIIDVTSRAARKKILDMADRAAARSGPKGELPEDEENDAVEA